MLSALITAVQTLTRIPVPSPKRRPDSRTLAWSAVFYPLVGLLLGLAAVAADRLLALFLPRSVVVLVILALWAFLTGGLHEDGLADTFDAFGSQTSREAILRVLKDSRTGSYGVVALMLSALLRWQGLALLPLEQTSFALVASQVLPRAGIVGLAYMAGPATAGLGGALAESLQVSHVVGASLLALAIPAAVWRWQVLAPAGLCFLLVALLGVYFRRKIGGVTGDCLGAANQLQEIAVVLLLLALREA